MVKTIKLNHKENLTTPPKYFYSRRKFINYLTSIGSFVYLTSKSESSFSNAIAGLHKNDSFINKYFHAFYLSFFYIKLIN